MATQNNEGLFFSGKVECILHATKTRERKSMAERLFLTPDQSNITVDVVTAEVSVDDVSEFVTVVVPED